MEEVKQEIYRTPVNDKVEPPGSQPLIELSGLTKIYGQKEVEVRALDDVNLQIFDGEFVAIMGPSGSGKSTCLNLIGCLDTPTSGSYRFKGVEVSSLDRNQRALLRRLHIGFVFQGYNLLKRTSALENVEMPLIYKGVNKAQRRKLAMQSLADVSLEGREHHTPSELSGGQQQRVAIARALVTNPSIVLADEPTGNLDSNSGLEIMELLTNLNQQKGITIIMVTHENKLSKFAQRTVHFIDGRIHKIDNNRKPQT